MKKILLAAAAMVGLCGTAHAAQQYYNDGHWIVAESPVTGGYECVATVAASAASFTVGMAQNTNGNAMPITIGFNDDGKKSRTITVQFAGYAPWTLPMQDDGHYRTVFWNPQPRQFIQFYMQMMSSPSMSIISVNGTRAFSLANKEVALPALHHCVADIRTLTGAH